MTMPKHIQDCGIKRVFYRYEPVITATNCDGSYGMSGGALLESNLRNHALVALVTGIPPLSKEEERQEIQSGRAVVKNFDDDKTYQAALAIEGNLKAALVEATR